MNTVIGRSLLVTATMALGLTVAMPGVAVAGDRDGAFVSPLKGTRRIGGFIGWGETKLALLGGSERRLLLTRQFQMVPWVF